MIVATELTWECDGCHDRTTVKGTSRPEMWFKGYFDGLGKHITGDFCYECYKRRLSQASEQEGELSKGTT